MYSLGVGFPRAVDLYTVYNCGFVQWLPFAVKKNFSDEE